MQNSLIFYRSFWDAVKVIDNPEVKAETYDVIMAYALDGVVPENLSGMANIIFTMAKPQIDANIQRRENGLLGGRPSKKPKVSKKENHRLCDTETIGSETEKPNVNVNENENKNNNGNGNGNRESGNTPTQLRKPYGTHRNVLLSDEELDVIIQKYPDVASKEINRLSVYMKENGKNYPNHFVKIMEWLEEDSPRLRMNKEIYKDD